MSFRGKGPSLYRRIFFFFSMTSVNYQFMIRRDRLLFFHVVIMMMLNLVQVNSFVPHRSVSLRHLTDEVLSHQARLFARGQYKSGDMKKGPSSSDISDKRKKQLGIVDEREYDLGVALANNTDPFITKLIAGSFITVVIVLLVVGIVLPSLSDYGEGVCNPIRTAGRY